jgi:hypothetical protein
MPYQRCYPVRDEALRKRWMREKPDRCQICGERPDWRGCHCHHIVRFRRSDEGTNFLKVCADCDDRRLHDGSGEKLTLAQVCAIKKRLDPEEYDHARLEALYGGPIEAVT